MVIAVRLQEGQDKFSFPEGPEGFRGSPVLSFDGYRDVKLTTTASSAELNNKCSYASTRRTRTDLRLTGLRAEQSEVRIPVGTTDFYLLGNRT